ncbi:recombinase family protein [Mycolicibacter kumamotonensis]|uniref:Recombinase family protein n=1 Tax=Mycolicibacter kumamotonensis TaxID=354243 RepID=A0A7K3LDZ8_9MYCO|nr:recombinase family protein [Mycolicibacter kumamotonensis]NDJ90577.1 recombinase family protein [Mycolicibacter kumamotonensis]
MTLVAGMYLRISADRAGEKLGVARQRADCEKLCAEKGWTAVEFCDNDVSAASGKRRPAYEKMLDAIREGAIGAVVTWDLDRLHRRPIELEKFMALADEHRLALATVSGDVDLSNPQGRLIARLKGNVAAHEIEQMKVRMRAAGRQRAESGKPRWRRAFGYTADTYELDPQTAPLVAQAYAAVLAGASLGDIARLFNEAGCHGLTGKPWTASTVSLFLRAPRNAGLRTYDGEIIGTGTWPPLVDESTWRAAQAVMGAPGRQPGRKSVRKHLLTGMLWCGKCGHHLGGVHTVGRQLAYACKNPACRGVSIRRDHVEPMVYELIIGTLAAPDAVDLLKSERHDTAEAEALRIERATLLSRLDEIADERADGLLTGAQARRATERITEKLEALEARQADQERLRVFDGIPLGTTEVAAAVEKLSPDRLRAIMDVLMTVTVMPVGKGGKEFKPERVKVAWK